jgi:hypothetical protein
LCCCSDCELPGAALGQPCSGEIPPVQDSAELAACDCITAIEGCRSDLCGTWPGG